MTQAQKTMLRYNVLIETLWNVKYNEKLLADELGFVLIETLWNVKILSVYTPERMQTY